MNQEDFGHYLAEHIEALRPILNKYASEWSQEALPVILQMITPTLVVLLIVVFFLNFVMGRLYAALFSPAQATLLHAFYFALCCLLVVAVSTSLITGSLIFALQNATDQSTAAIYLALALIVGVASLIFYVVVIMYFYRTEVLPAIGLMVLFSVAALIVGFPAASIILPLYNKTNSTKLIADFIDQKVLPKILLEAQSAKTDYATAQQDHFNAQKSVNENQEKITQVQAQTDELQKKIDTWKASDSYTLSLIGPIRAKGDLLQAEKAYQDFLTNYPNSSYVETVKAQLAETTAAYAAEQAAKQQAALLAAQSAADYQAKLLARVKTSGVTLSELHQFLFGKTREQVRELFGSPTETASDRWGYSQVLTLEPMSNHKYGLAIIFEEGVVQSLDYYYGGTPPPSQAASPTSNPANTTQ